jgi:hypothetical protein
VEFVDLDRAACEPRVQELAGRVNSNATVCVGLEDVGGAESDFGIGLALESDS